MEEGKDKVIMWLIFVFNLCTPIGIVLGILIAETSDFVVFIFLALAAGTN